MAIGTTVYGCNSNSTGFTMKAELLHLKQGGRQLYAKMFTRKQAKQKMPKMRNNIFCVLNIFDIKDDLDILI